MEYGQVIEATVGFLDKAPTSNIQERQAMEVCRNFMIALAQGEEIEVKEVKKKKPKKAEPTPEEPED